MQDELSIGYSDFYKKHNAPGSGNSFTFLTESQLIELVKKNWHNSWPGKGEFNLCRKIVVRIYGFNEKDFCTSIAKIDEGIKVQSEVVRRQEHEDFYIKNYVLASDSEHNLQSLIVPANFVSVVLYSKEALLENGGTRSTDCDWEIVALIASHAENEPMHPLTMARNMLEAPGGTRSEYTAMEFAEAIYYWSQYVKVKI